MADFSNSHLAAFDEEIASVTWTASSMQGVAVVGSTVYTSDNSVLAKRNSSGNILSSRNISGDGTVGHIGDICYDPDTNTLKVTANNYPTTPRVGYVMEYDLNLNFIQEWQVFTNKTASGIAYRNGDFWLVADGNTDLYEFNSSFVLQNTYSTDIPLPATGRWSQGIEWVGDELFSNNHENDNPEMVIHFHFTGTEFCTVQYIRQPHKDCTQGLTWDAANNWFVFARRGYDGRPDGLVFAYPRPIGHLRIGCRVNLSADFTVVPGAWRKIPFDTVDYDVGNHFDTSNNRFVAPVTGLYDVSLAGEFNDLSDARGAFLAVYVNGAEKTSGLDRTSANTQDIQPKAIDTVYVLAGQYIEGYATNGDTVNRALKSTAARTFLTISLSEKITA